MPFGLKSAGQTFQRLMDSVLQDIDCALVYLDGILIASSSEKEHLEDLKIVFRRLTSYSKLPAGRTISGVFLKNRHFSPIASVFLCGVFVLYCMSLKLSESTVFNHVFLISFESKGRR